MSGQQDSIKGQIIQVIANSRYGHQQLSEEKLAEVAAKLGVTVEIVQKAQKLASANPIFRAEGGGLQINAPRTLFPIIEEEAQKRNTTKSGIFRSVIHKYLANTWEPPYYDTWTCRGERHFGRPPNRMWRTMVPIGATEAFDERARRTKTTRSRLLRSLLVGFLNGDFYVNLKIVNKAEFSPNKEDYCLG